MSVVIPPIPASCANRPTVGGLVIPWVTVVFADGSPDWRACVRHRVDRCLLGRRCQICGQAIDGPAVFFAADDQLPEKPGQPVVTDVPPTHPVCAAYAAQVCPMLTGTMGVYASRPRRTDGNRHNSCPDRGCGCGGYVLVDDRDMAGHHAPIWFAVWAGPYGVTPPDETGARFAVVAQPLKIRPL